MRKEPGLAKLRWPPVAWDRDTLDTGSSPGCGRPGSAHAFVIVTAGAAVQGGHPGAQIPPGKSLFLAARAFSCLSHYLAQSSRGGVPQICSLAEDLLLSQYPSVGSRGRGVRLFTSASLAPGSLAGAGLGVKPSFPACVTPTPAPGSIPFGSPFSSTSGESLLPGAPRGETLHQALI